MSFPTAEERERIRNDAMCRERASNQRIKEAAQRILEVSAELRLTVHELEMAFERAKHNAVIGMHRLCAAAQGHGAGKLRLPEKSHAGKRAAAVRCD